MIEKDRGKRKGKVELVMHHTFIYIENLMDPFYILTRIIVKLEEHPVQARVLSKAPRGLVFFWIDRECFKKEKICWF